MSDYTIKSPTRLTTVTVIDSDNEDIVIQYSPVPSDDNIASSPPVCVKEASHHDGDKDDDDNKTIPYGEDFESSHDEKTKQVDHYAFNTDSSSDDDDADASSLSELSQRYACDSLQELRETFTMAERNKVIKKLYEKHQKVVTDCDGAGNLLQHINVLWFPVKCDQRWEPAFFDTTALLNKSYIRELNVLQVRSMNNLKAAGSRGINLYPHIKALNTAVRVTLNSIRSLFNNTISLFDFLIVFLYATVRLAAMISAKMTILKRKEEVQYLPDTVPSLITGSTLPCIVRSLYKGKDRNHQPLTAQQITGIVGSVFREIISSHQYESDCRHRDNALPITNSLYSNKESCLSHIVQAIPEEEGTLSILKLCEASVKTIKDAAYTVSLAYDEVLAQGDKVPNVRVSGVEDALNTIINYPLFNEDDDLSKHKICDFLQTAAEKLNHINAGMISSSIISVEKLFSNEDWGLCEVKKYSPDLTEARSLPGDSDLKAELCMYKLMPGKRSNSHFICKELSRQCKKRKLDSKIDSLLNKIVIKIKSDREKLTKLEEFVNKL